MDLGTRFSLQDLAALAAAVLLLLPGCAPAWSQGNATSNPAGVAVRNPLPGEPAPSLAGTNEKPTIPAAGAAFPTSPEPQNHPAPAREQTSPPPRPQTGIMFPSILPERKTAPPSRNTPAAEPSTATRPAEASRGTAQKPDEESMPELRKNGDGIHQEEQDVLEEALALLKRSDEYWSQGNFDEAIAMLDQAYALILDTNGDPDIARQKDDVRLLISKRIMALYSSQQSVTNGKRSEVPIVSNADVEKEIRLFQTVERDFFISSYERSGFYRELILKELKAAGLPEELSWLPLVESGFKISALSTARALGLWQFIPSTGYKYGLNRDDWIDERMDVEKSTRAAIDYLRELHNMFGDWLTVLAAYNCGEGRVMKVISAQHINYFDRFWDLYHQLPYETARYVPRFLATLLIIRDPQKYGMDLRESALRPSLFPVAKTRIDRSMRLQDIAQRLEMPEDLLYILNAELRHRITPDREYTLRLPPALQDTFARISEDIPTCEKPRLASRPILIKHRVKPGETVASIASRYNVPVKTIMAQNRMKRQTDCPAGRVLRIPITGGRLAQGPSTGSAGQTTAGRTKGKTTVYKVKAGDTLADLARNFHTTVDELIRINRLQGSVIRAGQSLRIVAGGGDEDAGRETPEEKKTATRKTKPAAKSEGPPQRADVPDRTAGTYTVIRGDSLGKIARQHQTTIQKLREWNKLRAGDAIRTGQILIVRQP